jgi:hypothetical protein
VHAALDWLERHQSADGHWDSAGFEARCRSHRCGGAGDPAHDAGVTALALRAFLGAGATHQRGPHRDAVKDGIKWLRDVQDADGCFGPRSFPQFLYDHACASLAMTEACAATGTRVFREPAKRAVAFILAARNPYLAWRYAVPPDGDNDTSVTGWMVAALESAVRSGIEIDAEAVRSATADAARWVGRMTDPGTGRVAYRRPARPPDATNAPGTASPGDGGDALTAAGLTIRFAAGRTPADDESLRKGVSFGAARTASATAGSPDFYAWYWGSLAMSRAGDLSGGRSASWLDAAKSALAARQRSEPGGEEHGSWDPADPSTRDGGRVGATALNCLALEACLRGPATGK